MLKNWKKKLLQMRTFLVARLTKHFMHLLIKTCHIQFNGMEQFCRYAANQKCILMLWHNRLAIVPFVLSRHTPHLLYAALVSASRDGEILSQIIHSYRNGKTIRVPHLARYQALRTIVRHVESQQAIVIMTPDGPRGPRYQIKPGIALAAIETQAYVFSLDWEAQDYWELKTWDRLRLPKPFTSIQVTFSPPLQLKHLSHSSLEEAKDILKRHLPCT